MRSGSQDDCSQLKSSWVSTYLYVTPPGSSPWLLCVTLHCVNLKVKVQKHLEDVQKELLINKCGVGKIIEKWGVWKENREKNLSKMFSKYWKKWEKSQGRSQKSTTEPEERTSRKWIKLEGWNADLRLRAYKTRDERDICWIWNHETVHPLRD